MAVDKRLDKEVIEGLRKSKSIIGPLHSVILDAEGNLVAGRHRKAADPSWPEVIRPEIRSEKDRILVRIHENYRKKMDKKRTETELMQLAEALEAEGVEPQEICPRICEMVPYTSRYVRELLPDRYKGPQKSGTSSAFEPKKRLFDVWSIAAVDLEKPFGDPNYPGAIPGDIVANVLVWFLPEGGKVVDPMAGGGVTEDVCRFLGPKYEVLLYDNFSLPDYKYRESITFNDILTGKLPEEANGADLIFADPPYGPQKEYGMDPEELFVLLRGLAKASWDVLNLGGFVSVLMQNYYLDGECVGRFVPLIRRTAEIMDEAGFTQIFEATVPLYGKVARSEDHMTHIDRRLMIFRKEALNDQSLR